MAAAFPFQWKRLKYTSSKGAFMSFLVLSAHEHLKSKISYTLLGTPKVDGREGFSETGKQAQELLRACSAEIHKFPRFARLDWISLGSA